VGCRSSCVMSLTPTFDAAVWRAVLGYDQELCREATSAFARELSRSLKHRAKQLLGLGSVDEALTGMVVVVQRTDGALRLNVHLHPAVLDGVHVRSEEGALVFYSLPAPSSVQVADIARRTARCLHQAFQAQGRPSPWDQEPTFAEGGGAERDPLSLEQPGLYACYEAAASAARILPQLEHP
jgi:hypothetical protein